MDRREGGRPGGFGGRGGPGGPGGPRRPGGFGGRGNFNGPRGPGGFGGPRGGRPGAFDQRPPKPKPPANAPEIVHRDRDLLVVVKASGQPTRRARGASLISIVNEHLTSRRERYRPVHDLDDVASGVVALVPITEDDDLREIRSGATYLALVEGELDTGEGAERSITGPVPGLEGKSSAPVTSVRRLASENGLTLIRVRARPDAPGQIRAHLASIGHRVVGDTEHGSGRDDVRQVALHAEEIRLRHPGNGDTVRFRCPAPASFYRAVGQEPPAGAKDDDAPAPKDRGWEQVAGWYDDLLSTRGSDHHEHTVLPGVERLLDLRAGERMLDVACGQGVLCERLSERGDLGEIVGVDASPSLVEAGNKMLGGRARMIVGDARTIGDLGLGEFDAAACVLALMNIDDLASVCAGVASSLKPGGRFVVVVLHPAFRGPQTTAWGWTSDGRTGVPVQFRRVDRYLSERSSEIVMNPGKVASGAKAVTTTTHHRPIGAYVNALAGAGLAVDAMEEWVSERTSRPGPRADAENVARSEIPMFLALRARRAR